MDLSDKTEQELIDLERKYYKESAELYKQGNVLKDIRIKIMNEIKRRDASSAIDFIKVGDIFKLNGKLINENRWKWNNVEEVEIIHIGKSITIQGFYISKQTNKKIIVEEKISFIDITDFVLKFTDTSMKQIKRNYNLKELLKEN